MRAALDGVATVAEVQEPTAAGVPFVRLDKVSLKSLREAVTSGSRETSSGSRGGRVAGSMA